MGQVDCKGEGEDKDQELSSFFQEVKTTAMSH